MENKAVDKTEDRLQKLEREVRGLRMTSLAGAVGVVLLCLFALFRILAGSGPGEVRARRFVVMHENGKTGVLLTVQNDYPKFSFYDADGDLRSVLELQGKGRPVMSFLDKEHHIRSVIGLSEEGNPGIAFWDNDNRTRANFKLTGSGEPALGLFGREGEGGPNAVLYLSEETGPTLNFRDVKGQDWSVGEGQ